MSIKRALVYEIHCDNCDAAWEGDEGIVVFPSAKEAQSYLLTEFDFDIEDDWTTDGLAVHCSECPPLEQGPESEAERARILEATGPDLFSAEVMEPTA